MRWRRTLGIATGGLALLAAGTVAWQHAIARTPTPAELERGRALYAQYCRDCHGVRMEGAMLPTTGEAVQPLDKRGFRLFFRLMPAGMEGFVADRIANSRAGLGGLRKEVDGRIRTSMPEFARSLSAEDRRALAALIRAVNGGEVRLP